VVCFSEEVERSLHTLSVPASRVSRLDPPIDVARFSGATSGAARAAGRRRLGIAPEAFTAGIVARMQRHRRFSVLLEAVRAVARQVPGFRFVIVGRGTHQETVAREPVRRMGLEETVVFAGYLEGDAYVDVLRSLDVKVFLVPGSDGTCRAVREAIAAGVPVVAARRDMLPEIVRDGVTGRIVDDTADGLAGALVELASDRERLDRMGAACVREAVARFDYRQYVDSLSVIYDRVLADAREKQAPDLARGRRP
jgi:glycosyltransferase involved in cell wall biosynthesis